MLVLAIPCQPSSNANTYKTKEDSRNSVGLGALKKCAALEPRMLVLEDVASLEKNQPEMYELVVK